MAGTMNWSDAYGIPSSPFQQAAPISAGGPGQSFVAPAFSSPGTVMGDTSSAPAFSLLGFVIILVALRIAVEMGGEG